MNEQDLNQESQSWQTTQTPPPAVFLPLGSRDILFALAVLFCALIGVNGFLYGGLNLVLALAGAAFMVCSCVYVLTSGKARKDAYGLTCVILSIVIVLSYLRSDEMGLKFLLLMGVMVIFPLGLSVLSGRNYRDPGVFGSLADGFGTLFLRGLGDSPLVARSLFRFKSQSPNGGRSVWNVIKGLLIAVPVLLVLLVLLSSADEAFQRIVAMLPDFDLGEIGVTIIVGIFAAIPMSAISVSLLHVEHSAPVTRAKKASSAVTVNTVLICVALLYAVYLLSQLAYLQGGFLGLLPSGYTAAQYARRGFFEMAVICSINLGIIGYCGWKVQGPSGMPALTRGLCLFIGFVNLFLVGSALSKMFLYIGYYGLTYLRVLTSLFMVWMLLATVLICASLFRKVAYMKALVVAALIIATVVSWAGLDTMVARYNVEQYLSGSLDTVDVYYLQSLGNAAVPYVTELLDCSDETVRQDALEMLRWQAMGSVCYHTWDEDGTEKLVPSDHQDDIRSWNYTDAQATKILRELFNAGVLDY